MNSARPLDGLTVVVTGGNNGIGLGLARAVAKAGASVAIWARNAERNAAAADRLRELGGRVITLRCDVSDEADVREAAAATVRELGSIDAAFANAGLIKPRARLLDTTLAQWREVQAVNLEGTFLTFRECARTMIEAGRPGALVGISSLSSSKGTPGHVDYAATKAGVSSLCRSVAVDLARHRIRCNSLVPGWIDTEMAGGARADDRVAQAIVGRTPVRRWGTPADLEAAAVYLANPEGTFHTGDEIVIDGGYSIF